MERKQVFYGVFGDFEQHTLNVEQRNDLSEVIEWCRANKILFSYEDRDFENRLLKLSTSDGKWTVNGSVINSVLIDHIKKINLVPLVCIKNYEEEEFNFKLARLDKELYAKYKSLTKKYDETFARNFGVVDGMNDVIEPFTGGVIFKDYEWLLMEQDNLKDLFDMKDSKGSRIYSVPLDNGIMLRGSAIYYYFACFGDRYQYTTKEIVNDWSENCINFLYSAHKALSAYEIKDVYSKRLLLAIIDNLRNIQLVILNAMYMTYYRGENVLFNINDVNNDMIISWHRLLDNTLASLRDICLYNDRHDRVLVDISENIKEMIMILSNSISYIIENNEIGYIFEKCVGLFRDTDNFWEEYIVLEDVFKNVEKSGLCGRDEIEVIGALSGAIELPLIVKLLNLTTNGLGISYVFQNNGMYMDKQDVDINFCYDNIKCAKFDYYRKKKVFLLDDNIMSGLTLQLIINELSLNGIMIDHIVAICRPDLNRLTQMKHFNKAFNIELIGSMILGLLSNVFYTKVPEGTNYLGMFTDGMGLYSQRIAKYLIPLYKNACFKKSSQVDVIKGYVEGR